MNREAEEDNDEMEFDHKPARQSVRMSVKASNLQGYNEETDEDLESDDSDFLDQFKNTVRFEDLDFKYKGAHNLNFVGKLKGQSKEKQDQLKDLDYNSDEDSNN